MPRAACPECGAVVVMGGIDRRRPGLYDPLIGPSGEWIGWRSAGHACRVPRDVVRALVALGRPG